MNKNCPHCGAPIKRFQRECEYCGSGIEGERVWLNSDGSISPIAPYGGTIVAELSLPMEVVFAFSDNRGREHYCKERILAEMANEILEHIEIQTYMEPTMDFRGGPYRVRGTLVLGAVPGPYADPYKCYPNVLGKWRY